MQVLLLQDVDNLGLAGDVTKVAPGYARNYLLPQQLATPATEGALKQAEAIRKNGEARRAREKSDAEAIAGQIGDSVLVFERRAGQRGQLYGSVTTGDIVEAIQEKFELEIERRKLVLAEPIRSLGEFDVTIRLMVEVATNITVAVIEEGKVYVPAKPEGEEDSEEDAVAEAEATQAAEEAPAVVEEPAAEAVAEEQA